MAGAPRHCVRLHGRGADPRVRTVLLAVYCQEHRVVPGCTRIPWSSARAKWTHLEATGGRNADSRTVEGARLGCLDYDLFGPAGRGGVNRAHGLKAPVLGRGPCLCFWLRAHTWQAALGNLPRPATAVAHDPEYATRCGFGQRSGGRPEPFCTHRNTHNGARNQPTPRTPWHPLYVPWCLANTVRREMAFRRSGVRIPLAPPLPRT
jgi:hypothetical protein